MSSLLMQPVKRSNTFFVSLGKWYNLSSYSTNSCAGGDNILIPSSTIRIHKLHTWRLAGELDTEMAKKDISRLQDWTGCARLFHLPPVFPHLLHIPWEGN